MRILSDLTQRNTSEAAIATAVASPAKPEKSNVLVAKGLKHVHWRPYTYVKPAFATRKGFQANTRHSCVDLPTSCPTRPR